MVVGGGVLSFSHAFGGGVVVVIVVGGGSFGSVGVWFIAVRVVTIIFC